MSDSLLTSSEAARLLAFLQLPAGTVLHDATGGVWACDGDGGWQPADDDAWWSVQGLLSRAPAPYTLVEGLVLPASSLLRKHGFGDGEQVWDWVAEHLWPEWGAAPAELDLAVTQRALLALVRERLLPPVEDAGHRVTLARWDLPCTHNPARADAVDGYEPDDYGNWPEGTPDLDGISVAIPAAVVVAFLRKYVEDKP